MTNKTYIITNTSGHSDKDSGFSVSKEIKALQSEGLNKYVMYTDTKDKILLVDTLNFTEQQLKDMWTEAKEV